MTMKRFWVDENDYVTYLGVADHDAVTLAAFFKKGESLETGTP